MNATTVDVAPVLATPVVHDEQNAVISPLASQVLLAELDYALAELFNLHTQGDYVKKSEAMDILLDFRQSIENFPSEVTSG